MIFMIEFEISLNSMDMGNSDALGGFDNVSAPAAAATPTRDIPRYS